MTVLKRNSSRDSVKFHLRFYFTGKLPVLNEVSILPQEVLIVTLQVLQKLFLYDKKETIQ